jgi:hypothetical protein
MRIRHPRSLTRGGVVFAIIIGTIGGAYIWKPLLKEELSKRAVDQTDIK